MASSMGPTISNTGLVLCVDAADKNSYPGSSTTWTDVSGNGYIATLTNGPVFSTSSLGIFVLDGTDDYIQTNLNQNVNNASITWEAWFWDSSAGGFHDNTAIISNYGPDATTPFTVLHISVNGYPFFGQRNSSGTEDSIFYSTNICNSEWHQIVGVVDSSNMHLYVDGVLRGSKTKVTGTTTSGQNIVIGSNHLGRYQSCRIAGVRVYNVALSSDQILQNYNTLKYRFFITPQPPVQTQKAIFGYGYSSVGSTVYYSLTNLVSNTGVVATDTAGVGTTRRGLAAAGYGTDKAIFGYGNNFTYPDYKNMTNLVSNTGVVATDTSGIGTPRYFLAAACYGTDKAIFGYGVGFGGVYSLTNLVSNTGVVANDTTGVGTVRAGLAAATYGTDKAIFGYGDGSAGVLSITNLVSNTGVVANDTTGVGTVRTTLAASGYGNDKAIFGYGANNGGHLSMTNLVSNTGIVATDTTGVGTTRSGLAAAVYGGDKSIFGYGSKYGSFYSMTNLVSNTGVVATDTAGVGTVRTDLAAAGYSLT